MWLLLSDHISDFLANMTEELHTKKYIAFSEDALSEQVARLQEICSQQASAIQNLTTSILQMSEELSSRPRNNSSDRGRHQTHLLNTYASTSSQSRKGPSSYPQKRPSHQPTVSHGKSSANSSKKVKTENTVYSKNSEEVEKPPQNSTVDFAQSQDARATFLGYLTDLRDHYQFEIRSQVVRANLCQGWIAVRPEELLARLRLCGQEAPTRKEFMDIVLSLGPEITRGRSVKFGRDTRRALAIPRKYFTSMELAIIDGAFTKNGGEDTMDDGEEEQEHEMGDTDGEGQ